MPDVSVVIPTHNRSGLLALTLRSALRQHGVDLEVVVVDDGSTDGTAAAVERLADPRVRMVRHATPLGVSSSRNAGIAEARGRWVAFLDDDDLWAPDKLARQLEAAEAARRSWVYAGTVNVDDRLRVLEGGPPPPPERVPELLNRYNPVPAGASNVMVRADALGRVGGFDPGCDAPRTGTCGSGSRVRGRRPRFAARWSPTGCTRTATRSSTPPRS
jgi:glycosyltransferase involved in cell wall biosynthesis